MNKVIHYIWLGGRKKPAVIRRCIASWRKHMPDWEIKEWNESNVDLDKYAFCREAYDAKKYAFAADVLRFDILYNEGGLYFDTDVKMLKDFTPLVEKYKNFVGYEFEMIAPGLVMYSAEPGNQAISDMLDIYRTTRFTAENGFNLKTVGEYFSEVLEKYGFVYENKSQQCDDFTVFPSTYFCPTDAYGNPICYSENTYSVHLFAASWKPLPERIKRNFKRLMFSVFGRERLLKWKKILFRGKNE